MTGACACRFGEDEASMDWILKRALSGLVEKGTLEIVTPTARHAFGDGTGAPIGARFHDSAAVRAFLLDPDLRLGELYMDGRLTMERGSIYDLLYVLIKDSRQHKAPMLSRLIDGIRYAGQRALQRNFPRQARQNVAHHYDLDERLYRLFLDDDMQYSCAYFETEDASLETAQLAKKRHVAAKLAIEAGNSVLDIGCGWGGLALYLARIAGAARVLGITLSEEQLRVARARALIEGASTIEFALADYRHLSGRFDRIVSVGMFEHVGIGFYDAYFAQCRRLLNDDGIMLLHTIGCSATPGFVMPWLNKYIFPGAYVASLSEILPVIERQGLIVSDIEILQTHYALTLRHWRERFMRARDEAARLYDERFCRMWEFYLAAGEVAFRCEDVNIFQIQLTKVPAVTPMTRDYIAAREARLRERERQTAHELAAASRPRHMVPTQAERNPSAAGG